MTWLGGAAANQGIEETKENDQDDDNGSGGVSNGRSDNNPAPSANSEGGDPPELDPPSSEESISSSNSGNSTMSDEWDSFNLPSGATGTPRVGGIVSNGKETKIWVGEAPGETDGTPKGKWVAVNKKGCCHLHDQDEGTFVPYSMLPQLHERSMERWSNLLR